MFAKLLICVLMSCSGISFALYIPDDAHLWSTMDNITVFNVHGTKMTTIVQQHLPRNLVSNGQACRYELDPAFPRFRVVINDCTQYLFLGPTHGMIQLASASCIPQKWRLAYTKTCFYTSQLAPEISFSNDGWYIMCDVAVQLQDHAGRVVNCIPPSIRANNVAKINGLDFSISSATTRAILSSPSFVTTTQRPTSATTRFTSLRALSPSPARSQSHITATMRPSTVQVSVATATVASTTAAPTSIPTTSVATTSLAREKTSTTRAPIVKVRSAVTDYVLTTPKPNTNDVEHHPELPSTRTGTMSISFGTILVCFIVSVIGSIIVGLAFQHKCRVKARPSHSLAVLPNYENFTCRTTLDQTTMQRSQSVPMDVGSPCYSPASSTPRDFLADLFSPDSPVVDRVRRLEPDAISTLSIQVSVHEEPEQCQGPKYNLRKTRASRF